MYHNYIQHFCCIAPYLDLNNGRHNASRHFRNKKKAYLKAKIEELETNTEVNNVRDLYRGINPLNAKLNAICRYY